MLRPLNKWYDRQQEPYRFLYFFGPMAALIVTATSGPFPFNAVALLLMCLAGLLRAQFIYGG